MNMKEHLSAIYPPELTEDIMRSAERNLSRMIEEQKNVLSPAQYKAARKRILERIAYYLALRKYSSEAEVLELLKAYYYPKVKPYARLIKGISSTSAGCRVFQKLFASALKRDLWDSRIKQNDRQGLVFDIHRCLYKDLCDFYDCPACTLLFCDGDWQVFGEMKKLKFERGKTLGQGDDLCDFHFLKR